jgi:signal transduction histidine kinase/ActR/RegA family two-component response regulator
MFGYGSLSLKGKLYLLVTVSVTSALVLSFFMFAFLGIKDSENFRKRQLEAIAQMLGAYATATLLYDDPGTAEELLASLYDQPSVKAACIYDAKGKPFAAYPATLDFKKSKMPLTVSKEPFSVIENYELNLSLPIYAEDDEQFLGTIYIREDLKDVYGEILHRFFLEFVVLLVSLSVAVLVAGQLQKHFMRPILGLVEAMRRVSTEGDYSTRVTDLSQDELKVLQLGFNRMLDQIETTSIALKEAHDGLEERIVERTAQLSLMNEELAQEINFRKETEKQLVFAKEAAEAANRTKSDFLANMSHEIRTPMTAILGFVDLLADPRTSEEETDEYIKTIRRNGHHLLSVINDILDISKIEAGKMEIKKNACSAKLVIEEVRNLMCVQASNKGLDFEVEYDGSIPDRIETDAIRLRQVLVNLLGNAIKFTEQGKVSLTVRFQRKTPRLNSRLQFVIQDTGIGMSEEQLDGVFDAFAQANTSHSRRFGGTGLGLTISRQFAKMLGGDLIAESHLGQGSTFTFEIAVGDFAMVEHDQEKKESLQDAKAKMAQVEKRAGISSDTLQGRILLVEDGKDNQRLISTLLRKAGAEVDIAENGVIAIEKIEESERTNQTFRLVLMDMQMPVCDGYEATRRLRHSGCQLPIVALTAHAMNSDREKCLSVGCDDYMVKPVDRKKLLSLASMYCGSPAAVTEA